MDSKERRELIERLLYESDGPLKGQMLAQELGVTRQVVVKDIAILRAEGKNIIATPGGYIIPHACSKKIRKIIAVTHDAESIQEELDLIVKFGGIVEDVIVEHPLYGEIKCMLMVKNMLDVEKFMSKLKACNTQPLLVLSKGIHLHTIEIDDEENLKGLEKELKARGFLLD